MLVLSSSVHCFHYIYSLHGFVIPVFVQQWLCSYCTSVLVQVCHVKWSEAGGLADNLVLNVILSVLSWKVSKPMIPWKTNDNKTRNYLHEKESPAEISCYGFCNPQSPNKKYIHPLEFLYSSAQSYDGELYSPLAETREVHLGNGEYPCISSSHPSVCMLLGF